MVNKVEYMEVPGWQLWFSVRKNFLIIPFKGYLLSSLYRQGTILCSSDAKINETNSSQENFWTDFQISCKFFATVGREKKPHD